jgi:hypothetical protein
MKVEGEEEVTGAAAKGYLSIRSGVTRPWKTAGSDLAEKESTMGRKRERIMFDPNFDCGGTTDVIDATGESHAPSGIV